MSVETKDGPRSGFMSGKKDIGRREVTMCGQMVDVEISASVSAREVMSETVHLFYMGCAWSTRPSVEE